jgi:hypothetical protein
MPTVSATVKALVESVLWENTIELPSVHEEKQRKTQPAPTQLTLEDSPPVHVTYEA